MSNICCTPDRSIVNHEIDLKCACVEMDKFQTIFHSNGSFQITVNAGKVCATERHEMSSWFEWSDDWRQTTHVEKEKVEDVSHKVWSVLFFSCAQPIWSTLPQNTWHTLAHFTFERQQILGERKTENTARLIGRYRRAPKSVPNQVVWCEQSNRQLSRGWNRKQRNRDILFPPKTEGRSTVGRCCRLSCRSNESAALKCGRKIDKQSNRTVELTENIRLCLKLD